jgi:hypothetical protein
MFEIVPWVVCAAAFLLIVVIVKELYSTSGLRKQMPKPHPKTVIIRPAPPLPAPQAVEAFKPDEKEIARETEIAMDELENPEKKYENL